MNKLLTCLFLISLGPWAGAQTPLFEPMPEGSHDAFVGLGLASRPSYEGSGLKRWQLEPVVQAAWASGFFISGTQAGWRLSDLADDTTDAGRGAARWGHWEWGPLLSLRPGRNAQGRGWFVDSPGAIGALGNDVSNLAPPRGSLLQELDPISTQLEAGAFLNLRIGAQWRLSQSLLAGKGRDATALRWSVDLQYALPAPAPHHSLSWSAGGSWSNAGYNRSSFGITSAEALRSGLASYTPGQGLSELRTQLRWNWALSPQWLLSTALQLSSLQGPARSSPLVERARSAAVSSALVYRF
ncbi:MipA/OmpV family protein [Paucibacter sp. APW11]|uniref:MipA/OmpV family protein n=1 Tax=Roseateles aquae TaxID=3077235 RepID=A0ABU3PDJ8_9BURK|nr:MipA/OmpV family protein [Paucibacter sp. APW11]MDT9000660.1 MipA/OmpV family protein [Paucibacter sp. APW11]